MTTMKANIPVVNVGLLETSEGLRNLDMACRDWGVFQIVDHGIDSACLDDVLTQMREFFSLPRDDKLLVERTGDNPWGYYDQELTKNTLDWKQIFDTGPPDGQAIVPQWPAKPEHFEQAITRFYDDCEGLAFRLLRGLALNLGLPAETLDKGFRPAHTSFVRLNYYPVCPQPAQPEGAIATADGYLGINPHTDAGALTLLLHDQQAGLQVLNQGAWHTIEVPEKALLVNIGDIVQVWSNDLYPAPLHRVAANDREERYSAPYFFNPGYDFNYAPLPAMIDDNNPARYREINWGEFRSLRALGDYGEYGTEVQIEQYRTTEPRPG
jgi:isopenicillin N synthase-like dioxygenase